MFTRSESESLRKKATAAFYASFKSLESAVDPGRFITDFTTTKQEIDFAWMGSIPMPQEKIGRRRHRVIFDHSYKAKPKTWELTATFDEETYEDDQSGTIAERAMSLARRAKAFVGKRFSDILMDGDNGAIHLAYDNKNLFATDHPRDDGSTVSNQLSHNIADPANPTVSEFEAALELVYELVDQMVDHAGEPIDIPGEPTLYVPYNYRGVCNKVTGPGSQFGRQLLEGDSQGGTGNFRGLNFVVNKFQNAETDRCYLLFPAAPGVVGPFVLGERRGWQFTTWDRSNSQDAWDAGALIFGGDSRWEIVPGAFELAYEIIFT